MAQYIRLAPRKILNGLISDKENKEPSSSQLQKEFSESEGLQQILKNAASTHAGITIYPLNCHLSHSIHITYSELLYRVNIKAQLINSIEGLLRRSVVLLHFDEHIDNIEWFWAVVWAGCIPAISTPFVNDINQRKRHLLHLRRLFSNPIILTREKLVSEFLSLDQLKIHPVEDLVPSEDKAVPTHCLEKSNGDLAVLMLTSGSTGNAKAVCLSHSQILSAVQAKSKHNGTTRSDIFLNWIGLDYVVNLVESHVHAMYIGAEQVHVQAADLLVEPLHFIRLIHKHRVTFTFAPNVR
ncbi:hypothetical protein MMC20_006390 [Loxospora ochrophaea]|nr:hypothetical protein [Loxospora ochrophaea]